MSDAITNLNLDFSSSPTIWNFLNDKSFVRGIMGPVGSGKSYACAAEIMLKAVKQKQSPRDGIKYSRFVVVRNSYPELRTTTIKTWQELFPENIWGAFRWSPPLTHHIKLPARDGAPGIDCEVIFLALDQPKDVRKLLSMELTGAWVNEARELPKAVIDGLTSVNASNYSDTFSVKPRIQDVNGPTMLEIEDRSHFLGIISCQFSANA